MLKCMCPAMIKPNMYGIIGEVRFARGRCMIVRIMLAAMIHSPFFLNSGTDKRTNPNIKARRLFNITNNNPSP